MNLNRLQELDRFDHLAAVELEDEDYGYRFWTPVRDSEIESFLNERTGNGYGLSDIDHSTKCECLASWDEWVFLLDFRALGR